MADAHRVRSRSVRRSAGAGPARRGLLLLLCAAACGEQVEAPRPIEVVRAKIEAVAFLEEHRLDEAEAVARQVVAMAPDDPDGHAILGLVHFRRGQLEPARHALERAISLDPGEPEHRVVLARILALEGDRAGARSQLEAALDADPDPRRALYALARLEADSDAPDRWSRSLPHLERLVDRAAGNVAARIELAGTLLRTGEADGAAAHMEELRRQIPVFPLIGQAAFDTALDAALDGDTRVALAAFEEFHDAMRTLGRYHQDLRALRGPDGILEGLPSATFLGRGPGEADPEDVAAAIRFVDITRHVGLDDARPRRPPSAGEPVAVAVGDLFDNGLPDIYVGSGLLFRNENGTFVEVGEEVGIPTDLPAFDARVADLDNSGRQDLYLVRPGPDVLLRNEGGGRLRNATAEAGIGASGPGRAALFVDVDHDGDLDLVLAGAGPARLYRNNMDGTFQEVAAPMGLAAAAEGTGVAFADWDDDDAIDLVVSRLDGPPSLFLNRRESRFEDVAAPMGLTGAGPATAVAAGDYDNDGFVDLFLAGVRPEDRRLWRNVDGAAFEVDGRPTALYRALADLAISDARFLDYDNDGWLDLIVAGEPDEAGARGLRLFRNAGPGEWVDVSSNLPHLDAASRIATLDFTGDGDLDLVVTLPDGSVRLLLNEGGNVNRSLGLRLVGLATGSGKNNHFGVGAKVEVRAGPLYQVRYVTDPLTVIGLGGYARAEVVRIRWPNGVPQVLDYPDAQHELAEEQLLKGSCPFLYAWDGEGFAFVTDVLWQSALGMPVGIGGAGRGRTYAPPDPSAQHVRIAGDRLRPLDGEYVFQLTSELWETIYLDRVRLVAVDHPAGTAVYVDERFPALTRGDEPVLHAVRDARPPASATDDRGRDLLPTLRDHDFTYVANLRPGPYQGVTEPHDLVLDLGPVPDGEEVRLFLRGWVFPTDASINVALAQSRDLAVIPPHLQVRDEAGRWVTVVDDLGFPAGKDKTLVVDLTERFRGRDRTVRIRTNMEIYWDHAFVAVGRAEVPVRQATLEPAAAELRERGFSRMYRKGGRYGPHWFDYGDVTRESPWRPILGPFTRLGDVLSLLREADDRYVVMAPGDAITLRFDARSAPPVPEGWTRTFLFYSEGWVKDADLNTATGERTGPLPFHGMSEYPYGPDEAYPSTPEHRRYLERFHTRDGGLGRQPWLP
jgi:tetratricopeptide (TPR) repeat protein